MRKNIHKKNPKHARYKNTPHKTARNKKSPSQKPNPKFIALWRRWTYKYTLNKIHLRHSEQKIIPTTATTHRNKFLSSPRRHATIRQTINQTNPNQKFSSHSFSQIIIFDTPDTQNHKTNLPVFMYHFGTHQHIIFSLYYVQFLWAPTTT